MHTAQSYTEKTHSAKAFHALTGRDFSGALDHGLKAPYSTSTVTTTIPNALTGALQPKTKPTGVNPARRLLITTDANGRAAVWFRLGKQSGEAGNMVQVSGSDANSSNANLANPTSDAISESVVFTATGDRGVPAKILAEGGGAQYAETGGQPLDALTAVTYDGEVNPVPGAVIAYVIEQDGGVDVDDGAKFTTSSASNALAISAKRKVLITTADNNGRSAARPTMGTAAGTVRISTYAMPPNTSVTTTLVEGLANGSALTTTAGLVGLATFQIAVLQQSDDPTQFTGKILDHTGKPLQGVRVTVSRTPLSVTTDAAGNFTFLQDVPQGKLDLFVDGRAVTGTTPLPENNQSSPTQYPSLHFEVLAIRGQKNILPHPIYLPPILMSQAKIVGGSEDVSLTIPGRDGFEMIVKANSVTFPDGTRIGPLVVSPVADDRLPMSPPGGGSSFMPGAAATIQPSGTRFDPPIEVRLPNTSGYAPGERVVIYHWDHDIGQYVAMGQATVTDDGAQLITDPGSGITKAGWHGPPVPPTPPNCGVQGAPRGTFAKIKLFGNDTDPIYVGINDPLSFIAEDDMQGNCSKKYDWSFGDGETSPAKNPFHSYALEGQKTVSLKAKCEPRSTCRNAEVISLSASRQLNVCEIGPESISVDFSEGVPRRILGLGFQYSLTHMGYAGIESATFAGLDVSCSNGEWFPFVRSANVVGAFYTRSNVDGTIEITSPGQAREDTFCAMATNLMANYDPYETRGKAYYYTKAAIEAHEQVHVGSIRASMPSFGRWINSDLKANSRVAIAGTSRAEALARFQSNLDQFAVTYVERFLTAERVGASDHPSFAEEMTASPSAPTSNTERRQNSPVVVEICRIARERNWLNTDRSCRSCQ